MSTARVLPLVACLLLTALSGIPAQSPRTIIVPPKVPKAEDGAGDVDGPMADLGGRIEEFKFRPVEEGTGKPIPGLRFRLLDPFGSPTTGWRKPTGPTLRFSEPAGHSFGGIELDAEGYRSLIYLTSFATDSEEKLEMRRVADRHFQVIGPDLKPASRAAVVARFGAEHFWADPMLTPRIITRGALEKAEVDNLTMKGLTVMMADEAGMVHLLQDAPITRRGPAWVEDGKLSIVALSLDGYAEEVIGADDPDQPLQLLRWASLEGTLTQGGKPVAQQPVFLWTGGSQGHNSGGRVRWMTRTDAVGRFRWDRLPPGDATLIPTLPTSGESWTGTSPFQLMVRPGITNRSNFELAGYGVRGVLQLKDPNAPRGPYRVRLVSESSSPAEAAFSSAIGGQGNRVTWTSTPGSNLEEQDLRSQGDTFQFFDVVPGRYKIIFKHAPLSNRPGDFENPDRLPSYSAMVEVSPANRKPGEVIDLGNVTVELVKRSAQLAPPFAFPRRLPPPTVEP